MILLMDIGNTNLKWASYTGQQIGKVSSVKHDMRLAEQMRLVCDGVQKPDAVYVANVAGEESQREVSEFISNHWSIPTRFIKTEHNKLGVTNAYQEPERLGVDRWLALIAVHNTSNYSALIVDAGSATTFDAISQSGEHLGGLILPGLEMMRESLLCKTSIPRIEAKNTTQFFASDTVEAVSAAAIQSTIALTERLYLILKRAERGSPRIVLTGGNAEILCPQISNQDAVLYVPKLIMKGLALIADHRENR